MIRNFILKNRSYRRFYRDPIKKGTLEDLVDLPINRYPHNTFLPRIWELRHNMTAYDAVYIALAETLPAPLITRDTRLASAPGHTATIELI